MNTSGVPPLMLQVAGRLRLIIILSAPMLFRGVTFRLSSGLPPDAKTLLDEFRKSVNEAIRAGIAARVTSRNALTKFAYRALREEHPGMYAQHLASSIEVAAAALRNCRRRSRKGQQFKTPFVKRQMMKAENQAYKLDRATGVVDLPIRAGCHVKLGLVVSRFHRGYLEDASLSLGSLTVLPDRVIVAFRREAPKPFEPRSIVSLDTNEDSLDGILLEQDDGEVQVHAIKAVFNDIPIIQNRNHDRRRRLQKKKAHDRRTSRVLCKREGTREHHRIDYRMHQVANAVVGFAEKRKSAVVLEDLKGMRPAKSKELNRRITLWPRGKLHKIIEYKAAWKGIQVIKVDPSYSSRRCPICGRIPDSRMGVRKEFACDACGWHMDRHINASMNLLQTAISNGLEVAGGLRFNPGAFQHDAVTTLYEPAMAARLEPNGTSRLSAVA